MAEPTVEQERGGVARRRLDRRMAGGVGAAKLSPSTIARRIWTWPMTLVVVAVGLVLAGQIVEDLGDSQPLQLLAPSTALRRWTLIVAVAYLILVSRVIDRMIEQSLQSLDTLVDVEAEHFQLYMARMRRTSLAVELIWLAVSAVLTTVIFAAMRTSLPIDDPRTNAPMFLPGYGVGAGLVLIEYTILGWAVLSLVWNTIRRARTLGELSREPLEINVFDTTNVLPLGNIALATALAPAGLVVILLFGFGRPSSPISWTLLVLVTLASLVALLLPLRGIHRQMDAAKEKALSELNAGLARSFEEANVQPAPTGAAAADLSGRVGTLVGLRKTVGEMTTWPFRDTIAFGRAVLIALAPIIYAVINSLINTFIIVPGSR